MNTNSENLSICKKCDKQQYSHAKNKKLASMSSNGAYSLEVLENRNL